MGGLEETLQGFKKVFSPLSFTVIIVDDSKEEEVEVKIVEPKAFQLVGLEHPVKFSLKLIP
jgi:hypothetical protein